MLTLLLQRPNCQTICAKKTCPKTKLAKAALEISKCAKDRFTKVQLIRAKAAEATFAKATSAKPKCVTSQDVRFRQPQTTWNYNMLLCVNYVTLSYLISSVCLTWCSVYVFTICWCAFIVLHVFYVKSNSCCIVLNAFNISSIFWFVCNICYVLFVFHVFTQCWVVCHGCIRFQCILWMSNTFNCFRDCMSCSMIFMILHMFFDFSRMFKDL